MWPYAGVSVFPEKGDGIFWHNLYTDTKTDELTLHRACGVLLGNKWIANKWIGMNTSVGFKHTFRKDIHIGRKNS